MSNRYDGFFLEENTGNNEFSYDERSVKKIYVPRLVKGSLDDLNAGETISFCEVEDGVEKQCKGLESFVEIEYQGKQLYVFDNHNHAFYFWCKSLLEGRMKRGKTLVHVDQHKDMRRPKCTDVDIDDMDDVFEYTNKQLNVGNFIVPAIENKIFEDVVIVDSSYSLSQKIPDDIVLDVDLDFFSTDMDYIDYDFKVQRIRKMIKRASVITFATSPFFIDQQTALDVLRDILEGE